MTKGKVPAATAHRVCILILAMFISVKADLAPAAEPPAAQPSSDADRAALLKIRELLQSGQTQAALDAANAALNQPGPAGVAPAAPATVPSVASNPPVFTSSPTSQPSQPAPPSAIAEATDVEQFSVHFQTTVISQKHAYVSADYSGPNSLQQRESTKTSLSATLFMGLRLPKDFGAIYFDPEVTGGEGLSGVTGIASFPNGDISHVGTPEPQPYVARAYYQKSFDLGGEREHVDSDANQLAGYQPEKRLTFTFGKVASPDFFDNNTYSHDPRTQFMNESLMDDSAWDYPADTRGYTVGGVIEYNEPAWAVRYGAFQEPTQANGGSLDGHIPQALGHVLESEYRWTLGEQAGEVRPMAYINTAHMGNYGEAIELGRATGTTPDVTATRTYSAKYGFSLSAEQAITADLGIWGRAGWNDGHTESWAFTEVDRLGSLGISLKGTAWNRPDDVFGFAGAIAGLSNDHRDYLRDGGLGFIIGDGQLNYAPEEVLEAYYLIKVAEHVFVTPDLQFVDHPAYNSDRGPVYIGGVRGHVEF